MVRENRQSATTSAEALLHAAEAVARRGGKRVVTIHGRDVALTKEPVHAVRPRRRRGLTRSDSLWSVVGAIDDPSGPTDISENKHRYLVEDDNDQPT